MCGTEIARDGARNTSRERRYDEGRREGGERAKRKNREGRREKRRPLQLD